MHLICKKVGNGTPKILLAADCNEVDADKIIRFLRDDSVFRINVIKVTDFQDFSAVFESKRKYLEAVDSHEKTRNNILETGL